MITSLKTTIVFNMIALLVAGLVIGSAAYVKAQSGGTWQFCFYMGLFGITIGPAECGGPPAGSECSSGCGGPLWGVCPTDYCWSVWVPDPPPAACATVGTPCGPSAANACGDTAMGTIVDNAGACVCNAVTPTEVDQCLSDVGTQCSVSECSVVCVASVGTVCGTSAANSCGMTDSVTTQCDGSCPAIPAAPSDALCSASCDPAQGDACTSSANACGMDSSGSIQCDGSCSAVTPSDALCASNANLTQPSVSHTLGTFNTVTNTYDTVIVRFQTSNNGGISTSPVNPQYRMRFDQGADGSYESTQSGAIGVLNAGQTSAMLSETFTNVPFGPNEVEVEVDVPDSVTESSEGDNTRIYSFGGMLLPPDPGLTITADPLQVRQGERAWITWDTTLTYPMDCRIVGPGTIVDPSGLSGTHQTDGINAKSEFTFTCTEPITGATFSKSVAVETTGVIEEI